MNDQEWKGSKESRLYGKVRVEKQEGVSAKYRRIRPFLDERIGRLWAANEAIWFGKGGIRAVAEALGTSPVTIIAGTRELKGEGRAGTEVMGRRQRRSGGGRKSLAGKHPEIVRAIEEIVDPATRGDPMAPLKWTSKSLKKIEQELGEAAHKASRDSISKILREQLGYTLQGLKKTKEGSSHEDRNAQFHHVNEKCTEFQHRGQPAISVDTKKKEWVGDFKKARRQWQPKGQPEEVRSHDFEDKKFDQHFTNHDVTLVVCERI